VGGGGDVRELNEENSEFSSMNSEIGGRCISFFRSNCIAPIAHANSGGF
jgi:hypothetical protein